MAEDGAGPTDGSGPLEPGGPERPGPDGPNVDHALGVETVITPEKGRWAVDIVVVFADGVVRRRIDTFHTEARAKISANLIKRAAERDIAGPLNG